MQSRGDGKLENGPYSQLHLKSTVDDIILKYDNQGQNAAFLLLPHGNSVPAYPDFDQGSEKSCFLFYSLVYLRQVYPGMM